MARAARVTPTAGEQRAGDEGFSLLEVLVAVVVLAVMSLAVFGGLVTALRTSVSSDVRTTAAALAAQELEGYDAVDVVANLTPTVAPDERDVQVGTRTYTVRTTRTWRSAGTLPPDRCSGPPISTNSYLEVTTEVGEKDRAAAVRSSSILTPKAGTEPSSTSQRVKVLDRAGVPRNGISVLLTPLSPLTGAAVPRTTDAYGCVLFANLADGNYRISVNASPFVGVTGQQLHERTVTLSRLSTPQLVELLYDTAVQVDVALSTSLVTTRWPRLPGLPATLVNSGMQPGGQRVQPWSSVGAPLPAATTTRALGLFPFASGYQAWMGGCPDSDPVRHGGSRPLVTVAPGASASVVSTGGRVRVTVQRSGTTSPIDYATVVAHNSCGGSYTLSGRTIDGPDAAESLARGQIGAVLPLGAWTFTVSAVQGWGSVTTHTSAPTSVTVSGASTYDVLLHVS